MKKIIHILVVCVLATLWGCAPPAINTPPLSMGEVDASRYIALGSDYTIGVSDFGVSEEGQRYAFPNLLAQQMQKVNQMSFNQAYIPNGYDNFWMINTPDSTTNWECRGNTSIKLMENVPSNGLAFPMATNIIYHNLGAPCLGVADIERRQVECPYLNRFSDTAISYLELVDNSKASFFTLELGFDDVWKFSTLGKALITPHEFEEKYRKLILTIRKHTQKGVLITIPDLTLTPYLLASKSFFKDNETCNPVPYYIVTDKGEKKLAGPSDFVSLYYIIKYLKNYPEIGSTPNNPIPAYIAIDSTEASELSYMTQVYNQIIYDLGKEYQLPVCDLNKMISDLKSNELVEDGVHFNDEFIFGGFYTLDGYSLSPRGNALLTNRLIEIINTQYKARIPFLNILDFPGQKYMQ